MCKSISPKPVTIMVNKEWNVWWEEEGGGGSPTGGGRMLAKALGRKTSLVSEGCKKVIRALYERHAEDEHRKRGRDINDSPEM